jgi:predicted nucleotidyltransferase
MCAKKWDNDVVDYGDPVEAVIPGVQGRVLTVLARTETELTMRTVAELAGVSANQATVVLNRLVHLGLVERREVGSAALVCLVRDNEAARAVLALVDLQRGVLTRLAAEAGKIRPAPACLAVFGSFARGDARHAAHENSDIDVLAMPPPGMESDRGQWTTTLGEWADRAARIAGNPVNLLEVTADELPKLIRRRDRPWRTIVDEGVLLVGDFPPEIKAAS